MEREEQMKIFHDSVFREYTKTFKMIFNHRIKINFMMEMLDMVLKRISNDKELLCLFDLNFKSMHEGMITGDLEAMPYEVCRNIVSLHRSNCIFISEEERIEREKSSEYKNKLAHEVIKNIRLRRYAAVFFRKKQLMPGDEFLFFHVPYQLFAITTYAMSLINKPSPYNDFYVKIFNKSLSALVLMGDNFLDSCYSICRGIIELYLKFLVLKINDNALSMHDEFVNVEINRNCCERGYGNIFNDRWDKRINKHSKNKVDYLHYGWVDLIDGYHEVCGSQSYSPKGLINYLVDYYGETDNSDSIKDLQYFYKMCHAYTHGNVGNARYPLLHYFEISIILYTIVVNTYKMLCEEKEIETSIEGFDIIKSIEENAIVLFDQYSKRTTENFEAYYSFKNYKKADAKT